MRRIAILIMLLLLLSSSFACVSNLRNQLKVTENLQEKYEEINGSVQSATPAETPPVTPAETSPAASTEAPPPLSNAVETTTQANSPLPSVTQKQQNEAIAFVLAYNNIYEWVEDDFFEEYLPVILISSDMSLTMTTNELEYMNIFTGRASVNDDGTIYTCIVGDEAFTLTKDAEYWIINFDGELCFIPENGDLYKVYDVQTAMQTVETLKNKQFQEPDN